MQDIVENYPNNGQSSDPPGEDHEGLDAIDAVWVVTIITTDTITFRAFLTGFVTSGFFLALFHGIRWEGAL
jgi:hypothetical protein